MHTCRLHIVSLPYYEVGGCLDDFFAKALGRSMTLRPDPSNDFDVNAFCAYDWQGRHVGYVASHDLEEAWRSLRGSGRLSLRGRIVQVNAEHKCVVFECRVETLGDLGELYPAASFLDWTYTGPVLKPTQELVTLDYMMDEISERLDEYDDWSDEDRVNFEALTNRFCQLSRYDLSGEMSDFRRQLCLRISGRDDAMLAQLAEELRMAFGRSGRETHGGEVLNYWIGIVSKPKNIKSLMVCRHEYDVDKVRRQLEAFPESMYEEWQENREHFVAKLLYMHVPRNVLWRLLSGIAFVEAIKVREPSQADGNAADEKLPAESPVYLNGAKGQKIDLIRVLNVMYEQGRFRDKDGAKLLKKDFFREMGRMLHIDLSSYDNDLSRAMSDGTKLEKHTKVFDEMKQKMVEIWNSR